MQNTKMSQDAVSKANYSIDNILVELGIGAFQVMNYIFIVLTIICIVMRSHSFIFTARNLSYKCYVPDCDNINDSSRRFNVAVSFENDKAEKCQIYTLRNTTESDIPEDVCNTRLFDNTSVETCTEWITDETDSIVKSFDLQCEDWKRSLVGTINAIGEIVSFIIGGLISDKYGRRNVIIVMTAASAVIGILQSFSNSYWLFLGLEFLNMATSAGAETTAYIMAVEIVRPINRANGILIIEISKILAALLLGLCAWAAPTWRTLLIIANVPSFILLLAVFAIPESFRWLYSKGRSAECAHILENAAKQNGVKLSQSSRSSLDELTKHWDVLKSEKSAIFDTEDVSFGNVLRSSFTNPFILCRMLICALTWCVSEMVFYGLSINSVNMSSEETSAFFNFLFVTLAEIPGILLYFILGRCFERKYALIISLWGCGISCMVFAFTDSNDIFAIVTYLSAKVFISSSVAFLITVVSEVFPTNLRNSIVNSCSMFGSVGAALATQIPLLSKVHPSLPMGIYGISTILVSCAVLKLPKTRNEKLPDFINEMKY